MPAVPRGNVARCYVANAELRERRPHDVVAPVAVVVLPGFLAALRSESGAGEVINLGSNFEISIGETAETIAELMGVELDILNDEQRLRPEKSEVERLWADNTTANNLLNWSPEYGGQEGLRRGLKETIDWFIQPKNLSAYKVGQYTL